MNLLVEPIEGEQSNHEDEIYLSKAVQQAISTRDFRKKGDFDNAIKFAGKAYTTIETLYKLRKDQMKDMEIL